MSRKWIYPRGRRLWCRLRDESGKWISRATPYDVGDEDKAEAYSKAAQTVLDERRPAGRPAPAPRSGTRARTVESYSRRWLDAREGRVQGIRDERARFRLHINPAIGAMRLDEVKPRHVRDLILGLRDKLAPRTVRNVYATLRTMFRDAEIEELVVSNPVKVPRGVLPAKQDKDPAWRATAVFSRGEIEALISSERIPLERRVLWALLALTGCRFGEVAALRWRALDRSQEPLSMLSVHASYDVRSKREKQVKTGVARRVPVHPTLAPILAEWRLAHPAGDDELIVPNQAGRHLSQHKALKRFHADLERLGLRPRRIHDLRRSFITLAQVDGARRDLLEVVTHGPRGDIMTAYTSYPWPALCAEVAKLKIERREGAAVVPFERSGEPATVSLQSPQGAENLVRATGFEPVTPAV